MSEFFRAVQGLPPWVIFLFAGVAVIILILIAVLSFESTGKFCPYINDPNFNPKGCTDQSSDANCSASVVSGFTADPTTCYFENPNACVGASRPSGCNCISDSQCDIGDQCTAGTCKLKS